jgi:UrcA family protein
LTPSTNKHLSEEIEMNNTKCQPIRAISKCQPIVAVSKCQPIAAVSKCQPVRAMALGAALVLGFSAASVSAAASSSASTSSSQFVSGGVNSYVVRFPDLDLNKIDGAAALYSRLRHAAGIVCGSLQSRVLTMDVQYRACTHDAVAAAVAGISRPILSQYYESRTKGDKTALRLANAN